jgi:hypothetical protein
MDEGVTIDKAHYGSLEQAEWLEGHPDYSRWSGLKTKGKDRLPVITYRCSRCGYLESYANPRAGA